jgi:hypothetical protein
VQILLPKTKQKIQNKQQNISVKEVTTDVVETVRKLEIRPKDVTELLQFHDKI